MKLDRDIEDFIFHDISKHEVFEMCYFLKYVDTRNESLANLLMTLGK